MELAFPSPRDVVPPVTPSVQLGGQLKSAYCDFGGTHRGGFHPTLHVSSLTFYFRLLNFLCKLKPFALGISAPLILKFSWNVLVIPGLFVL